MASETFAFLYNIVSGQINGSASGGPFTVTETVDDNVFDIDAPEDIIANPGTDSYLGTTANDEVYMDSSATGVTFLFSNIVYATGTTAPTLLAQDLAFCFGAGTLISTPKGTAKVETLQPGDTILAADGRSISVKWVGRQTLATMFAQHRAQPVRIRAGALGNGVPNADLTVTPDHGMILDDLVINASTLINGTSIDWVPMADLPERVTYYHIETEAHDTILANGAVAETFVDVADRRRFDNHADYLNLFGSERVIAEMNRPRISSQRLLPQSIRQRLGIIDQTALTA